MLQLSRASGGILAATSKRVSFTRMLSSSSDRIVDYSRFLSKKSCERKPSAIRALMPLLKIPGMISLGGGMPNPSTFPFESMSFKMKNGEQLELEGAELEDALQYSPTPGLDGLNAWLKDLQLNEHRPPLGADSLAVSVTNGSQDALTKAFEAFLDEGSSLLVEEPTYSGALAFLKPHGVNLVGIETDGEGLVPESLDEVLTEWDEDTQGPKPKVLYTIPTGCNPTGASLSFERKQEVYYIACRHDLLILEDDPYYYLQYRTPRLKSFMSLDITGRVLRFDSFSKILSSGLRVGFASGPPDLLQRIDLHSQATTMHPSGLSQAVVLSLLRGWGVEGFERHVQSVVRFYDSQAKAFLSAAQRHLTGLATWTKPTAGMFVWFRLVGVRDSFALIEEGAKEKKVLLVPGAVFSSRGLVGRRPAPPSPHVRAAFSSATPEDMDEALKRFAALVREAQQSKPQQPPLPELV